MTYYKIYDNEGETLDRYTIAFYDGAGKLLPDYIGASDNPSAFYQHGYRIDPDFLKTQKLIDVAEVSPELQLAILRELQGKE